MRILGECLGVKITDKDDMEPEIHIIIEDDGDWIKTDCSFSAYWLQDLIDVLEDAKVKVNYNQVVQRVQKAMKNV